VKTAPRFVLCRCGISGIDMRPCIGGAVVFDRKVCESAEHAFDHPIEGQVVECRRISSMLLVDIAAADIGVGAGEPNLFGGRRGGAEFRLSPEGGLETEAMFIDRQRVQVLGLTARQADIVKFEQVPVLAPERGCWY